MWNRLKINHSGLLHITEGIGHLAQQCGSLMCFNNLWTTMEIYGRKHARPALNTQAILAVGSVHWLFWSSRGIG